MGGWKEDYHSEWLEIKYLLFLMSSSVYKTD